MSTRSKKGCNWIIGDCRDLNKLPSEMQSNLYLKILDKNLYNHTRKLR